eukprot:CAMPEP_0174848822 /NCGR_PEP_ID=MMETSP1114-20130205/13751_1 /TAXON_ID=312471 /ORGANISM="Neobodo designis, Strain CCAP 1951/1" /LENGTH=93 /DNA_ID=CAMNT_0016083127 /DNA_START=179 /DNA_END=457 /DNA_ORIENTATION=-
MPNAVRAFTASPFVEYETMAIDPPAENLSCGGDFADPGLDDEMRRFLWRDVVPPVLYVVCAVNPLIHIVMAFTGIDSSPLTGAGLLRSAASIP